MKARIVIFIFMFLGGCASWPDEGQGGLAEKYQNYPLDDRSLMKHLINLRVL